MKRLLVVFAFTALAMIFVFRFAGWYADTAALPRYCENPRATIGYVNDILTRESPIGDAKRRPYLVAAKLIFLVPQQDGETNQEYLDRLLVTISEKCATPY